MTACPNCFQEVRSDSYTWMCTAPQCKAREEDKIASAYLGSKTESGPFFNDVRPADAPKSWKPRSGTVCETCSNPHTEVCPMCHFPLPKNWRTFSVVTVAMNGARTTGKSLYIAVNHKQLAQWLMRFRSTIEPFDASTRDRYKKNYETPLFQELGVMPPTAKADAGTDGAQSRLPLIFSLGVLKGARRLLVIRDVAGEDMENAPEHAPDLEFLRHADAIFFMFDPLAVPAIRDKLKELVPQQQHGGDPRVVLTNMRRVLGDATPRVAVIVSKFDGLQALRNVDDVEWKRIMSHSGAAFMRDPSLDSIEYDDADGELLSLEVESLLRKLGAEDFVYSLGSAQGGQQIPHRFFAVSVLGESPIGEKLNERGISPFRIIDPMKWVLSEKGII